MTVSWYQALSWAWEVQQQTNMASATTDLKSSVYGAEKKKIKQIMTLSENCLEENKWETFFFEMLTCPAF